jgi:ABC-type amino acid transport substrate-binding protein
MLGSSQLELIRSLGFDVKIQLTDFAGQSSLAVTEGEADFTVIDSPTEVGEPISDFPGLYVAQRLKKFGYGVALRKGSDLAAPLNAYLAQLRDSGEIDRLTTQFFPTGEKPLPAAGPKPEKKPDH